MLQLDFFPLLTNTLVTNNKQHYHPQTTLYFLFFLCVVILEFSKSHSFRNFNFLFSKTSSWPIHCIYYQFNGNWQIADEKHRWKSLATYKPNACKLLDYFKSLDPHKPVGLVVRRYACKWTDISSSLYHLSFLSQKCGLWAVSCDFAPHN